MYLLVYLLGLFTWVGAVALGKAIKKNSGLPFSYACFEEDCDFKITCSNLQMINEAVVFHWGEHPMERTRRAAS